MRKEKKIIGPNFFLRQENIVGHAGVQGTLPGHVEEDPEKEQMTLRPRKKKIQMMRATIEHALVVEDIYVGFVSKRVIIGPLAHDVRDQEQEHRVGRFKIILLQFTTRMFLTVQAATESPPATAQSR